ncbi:hypothetical protein VCR15J2_630237 [Vibrio coralliirubri]|nr:hypothetical protein VCR15J2_630237 [Vibrio coralliirubri]
MRTRQKFSISSYSTIKISNDVIECFNQLGRPVIYYDWNYTFERDSRDIQKDQFTRGTGLF